MIYIFLLFTWITKKVKQIDLEIYIFFNVAFQEKISLFVVAW